MSRPMGLENRNSQTENWLPDMDLNHDKQIQSLLCYRYTIGQAGAFGTLKGLMNQSSRQTRAEMTEVCAVDARPHPGPLPRGEGEQSNVTGKFVRPACSRRASDLCFNALPKTSRDRCASQRRMVLPILGERAGARADLTTSFSPLRTTDLASRTQPCRRNIDSF